MSDLPGLAVALVAQACLLLAWWRQRPGRGWRSAADAGSDRGVGPDDRDRRVPRRRSASACDRRRCGSRCRCSSSCWSIASAAAWPARCLARGIDVRGRRPRLGRSAAGRERRAERLSRRARHPGRRGLRRRRDAVSQSRNARAAAFALVRTFVHPWDSTALAAIVLVLAAAGIVHLLVARSAIAGGGDRRSRSRISSFICCSRTPRSFATPCRSCRWWRFSPSAASRWCRLPRFPRLRRIISIAAVAIASPVLVAYSAEPSPTVRVLSR